MKNGLNKKNPKSNISNEAPDKSNLKKEVTDFALNDFVEVAPLNYEIDNKSQKDLSSIPILRY